MHGSSNHLLDPKNHTAGRIGSIPDSLKAHDALGADGEHLRYYRCISALSQKGLKSVSTVSAVDRIEQGLATCTAKQSLLLASAINANLTAIYSVALPDTEKMKGLMYATAGTTIDGSWRNAIGVEGERLIKSIFLKNMLKHGELQSVTKRDGKAEAKEQIDDDYIENYTSDLISATFKNGSIAKFGSEPDITLVDSSGKVIAGIEIKAGIDPAGALERLGAMLKSFENILLDEPSAETILIASCITNEVEARLKAMKGVSRTYVLTDVVQNKNNNGVHLTTVFRGLLGLVDRRY